ncbi:hypothetical protein T492DRAFT_1143759, partial [Pavlovales sp. CCMP2436]
MMDPGGHSPSRMNHVARSRAFCMLAAAALAGGGFVPETSTFRLELGANPPSLAPRWCVGRSRPPLSSSTADGAPQALVAVLCEDPRAVWAGALAENHTTSDDQNETLVAQLRRHMRALRGGGGSDDAPGFEGALFIAEPLGLSCLGTRRGWFGGDADVSLVPCGSDRMRRWTLKQSRRGAADGFGPQADEEEGVEAAAQDFTETRLLLCLGSGGDRCIARARSSAARARSAPQVTLRRRHGWQTAPAMVTAVTGAAAAALLVLHAEDEPPTPTEGSLAPLEELHDVFCSANVAARGAHARLGAAVACAALKSPWRSLIAAALVALVATAAAAVAATSTVARKSVHAERERARRAPAQAHAAARAVADVTAHALRRHSSRALANVAGGAPEMDTEERTMKHAVAQQTAGAVSAAVLSAAVAAAVGRAVTRAVDAATSPLSPRHASLSPLHSPSAEATPAATRAQSSLAPTVTLSNLSPPSPPSPASPTASPAATTPASALSRARSAAERRHKSRPKQPIVALRRPSSDVSAGSNASSPLTPAAADVVARRQAETLALKPQSPQPPVMAQLAEVVAVVGAKPSSDASCPIVASDSADSAASLSSERLPASCRPPVYEAIHASRYAASVAVAVASRRAVAAAVAAAVSTRAGAAAAQPGVPSPPAALTLAAVPKSAPHIAAKEAEVEAAREHRGEAFARAPASPPSTPPRCLAAAPPAPPAKPSPRSNNKELRCAALRSYGSTGLVQPWRSAGRVHASLARAPTPPPLVAHASRLEPAAAPEEAAGAGAADPEQQGAGSRRQPPAIVPHLSRRPSVLPRLPSDGNGTGNGTLELGSGADADGHAEEADAGGARAPPALPALSEARETGSLPPPPPRPASASPPPPPPRPTAASPPPSPPRPAAASPPPPPPRPAAASPPPPPPRPAAAEEAGELDEEAYWPAWRQPPASARGPELSPPAAWLPLSPTTPTTPPPWPPPAQLGSLPTPEVELGGPAGEGPHGARPSVAALAEMAPLFNFRLAWSELEGCADYAAADSNSAALAAAEALRLPPTPSGALDAAHTAAEAAGEDATRAAAVHQAVAVAAAHYRAGMAANAAADTEAAAGHFGASLVAWPAVATLVSLANMHLKLSGANAAMAEALYASLLEGTSATDELGEADGESEDAPAPSPASPRGLPIAPGQRRLIRRKLTEAVEQRARTPTGSAAADSTPPSAAHGARLQRAADAALGWLL